MGAGAQCHGGVEGRSVPVVQTLRTQILADGFGPQPAVLGNEFGHETDHADATVGGQPAQYVVGNVAYVIDKFATRRMAHDHRCLGDVESRPHRVRADVGEVDEHPEPVHLPHHVAPECAQPAVDRVIGGGVRPGRVVVVGQREIANAQPVQGPQGRHRGADGVAPLGAQQGGDAPGGENLFHGAGRQRQAQLGREALDQLVDEVDLLQGLAHRVRVGQCRRDVDRPELCADPPLAQPDEVGLRRATAGGQVQRGEVVADGLPDGPGQVVVPIDQGSLGEHLPGPVERGRGWRT